MRRASESAEQDDDVDLNPLIDIVTLLIVFFILGGRLSDRPGADQITAPPGLTGAHIATRDGWDRVVVDVARVGAARDGAARVTLCGRHFVVPGADLAGYAPIRALLDRIHDHAGKMTDPAHPGQVLPRVTLELRADGDAPYRVVQELQQIAADTLDPTLASGDALTPRPAGAAMRPFTSIEFTVRPLDGAPVLR